MPRGRIIALAGTALALPGQPALAQQDNPLVLAPSSRWVADFADERCTLVREFSNGPDSIRLQLDSFGPTPGYRVTISGNLIPMSRAAPLGMLRAAYSPDSAPRPAMQTFAGELGGQKAVSFTPGFLADAPWDEARKPDFGHNVTHVTFDFAGYRPFRLETGSMAEPFKVMEQCADDLLASWGIDPSGHRARSRPPLLTELPEGYRFVAVDLTDKYPSPTERRYREQARVTLEKRERPVPTPGFPAPVRIMIDAAGRPTDCVAQSEVTSDAALKATCENWAGPWQPARDAEGRPVASLVQVGL